MQEFRSRKPHCEGEQDPNTSAATCTKRRRRSSNTEVNKRIAIEAEPDIAKEALPTGSHLFIEGLARRKGNSTTEDRARKALQARLRRKAIKEAKEEMAKQAQAERVQQLPVEMEVDKEEERNLFMKTEEEQMVGELKPRYDPKAEAEFQKFNAAYGAMMGESDW